LAVRKEVRLAGAGVHGMIEAGLVLQSAAAIYDDLNAHHVQSYGPEARGNAARSEVIISDGDIDYPKATQVDAMVATTQEALEQYGSDLKPDALVVVDSEVTAPDLGDRRIRHLPLFRTAEEKLGKPNLVYVVALGALVEMTQVVTKPALEAAVKDHVPRGSEELHLSALEEGYRLGTGGA
jgi:2-oxoglutarate ferredoxin oxidoreductase subunit gamma